MTRLGKRIVTQLGVEDSVDTLARWMSHRAAELVERGNKGDENAKSQAADLILRLWAHRSDWPQGWPPEETEALRRRLAGTRRGPQGRDQNGNSLLWYLGELDKLHSEEYEAWLTLALADPKLGAELEQAHNEEEDLKPSEAALLEPLRRRREIALKHFDEEIDGEISAAAKLQVTRDTARLINRRRQALLRKATTAYEAADEE